MKITSPYNFVPLSPYMFYPSWSEEASQDLPFSDSEDGIMEVAIHTVSPFFSRDGKEIDGKKSMFSSHVMGADGKRHYFIPATTIKGMLREMVEIMSFGKMLEGKDYQNRYFGWRDVANATNKSNNTEYNNIVTHGKAGWLKKDGDKYTFSPCTGKVEKIPISDVKEMYPSYTPDVSVWNVNASVEKGSDGISPTYPEVENGDTYRLVCTGKIANKKHELLFPVDTDEPEELDKYTIVAFKTLYQNTPGFAEEKVKGQGCYLKALEEGMEIPVFKMVRDGKTYLGMSKMFRVPYKYNVKEQVECIQKADQERPDLAETLFGYTGTEKSLKGRVTVGHAFMDGIVDDKDLKPVSGILGSPKVSFYPLYIKQQHSPYKTYDNLNGIAGRKLYRIHKGGTTTDLPKNENNENIGTDFRAIPEGQTFRLRITLHNTRPVEIGAVLAALSFNGTKDTFFNLGMAKPFGYGKCKVNLDDIKLSGFSHDAKHYMHEFEEQMSIFMYGKNRQQWAATESMTQLVNILSEHDDETVKMMKLQEYTDSKKENKNPFNSLQESGKPMNSLLDADEREAISRLAQEAQKRDAIAKAREQLASLYEEAERHMAAVKNMDPSAKDSVEGISEIIAHLSQAQDVYNQITDQLLANRISIDEENAKIADIGKEIEQWKILQEAKRKELERERRTEAGLAGELDKLAGDGKSYSVKEFKVYFKKIEKWIKDKGTDQLTGEELAALENTAKRILAKPDKKDVKNLEDFTTSWIWKQLVKYLGEDRSKALFDYYTSIG